MSRTDTAVPATPKVHSEAVGMAVAGVVATAVSVAIIPVTLVVILIVRSQEMVPRLVQAVAQRLPKRGAR